MLTQASVFHWTERSRILEAKLSPPISQHWIKQNLLPPTHCCLSLTTKTTCQSLPTQKPLEFSSKVKERYRKISQAHQAQIAVIPFKLSAVIFFEISGWIRWEARERGISCTKNMPQIKTRKVLLPSRAALLGQNCQCFWAKTLVQRVREAKANGSL